jgi:hypothetical protein
MPSIVSHQGLFPSNYICYHATMPLKGVDIYRIHNLLHLRYTFELQLQVALLQKMLPRTALVASYTPTT